MIRFIIVCICVIGYLILSIPILLAEWVVGKFNRRAKDISSLRIIQTVFKFILKVTGADITIIGHENVPKDQAVLYIGNHRSFFDILLTYVLCPDLTGYVAKKEMEPIPLLSTWMRYLHCLFLDRKDIKEGMKTILTAIEKVKAEFLSVFSRKEPEIRVQTSWNSFLSMTEVLKLPLNQAAPLFPWLSATPRRFLRIISRKSNHVRWLWNTESPFIRKNFQERTRNAWERIHRGLFWRC